MWHIGFTRSLTYEPRRQKTGLRGFRPGPTQTGLRNYWTWLETWNFRFRKQSGCTVRVAKTKALISFGYPEADLRLCFRICKNPVFSRRGSYCWLWSCQHLPTYSGITIWATFLSICENKDADQLRGNLCFCYTDSTIPLLHNMKFQASTHVLWLPSLVCVWPGWKP